MYSTAHCNNVCGLCLNGDILMMRPDGISCFLFVVRFSNEISCLMTLVPRTVVSK